MASQAALILCYEYTFDDLYTFYRACRSLRRILNGLERSEHTVKIPLDYQEAMSRMASAKAAARSCPMNPKPVAASCATTDSKITTFFADLA